MTANDTRTRRGLLLGQQQPHHSRGSHQFPERQKEPVGPGGDNVPAHRLEIKPIPDTQIFLCLRRTRAHAAGDGFVNRPFDAGAILTAGNMIRLAGGSGKGHDVALAPRLFDDSLDIIVQLF